MKLLSAAFAFLVLAVLVATPAHAQATRTWVSGVGDDANPCSRTAPCKTFAGAISKTAAGGEISVLDPAASASSPSPKPSRSTATARSAGILSAGTNGIIVNAGVNDNVIIRKSQSTARTGINGIRFLAGKSLTVDNCTISGFTTRGIDMSVASYQALCQEHQHHQRCHRHLPHFHRRQGAGHGRNVHLTGLTNGIEASNNGRATISNSIISGNSQSGVLVSGSVTPRINVEGSQVSLNDVFGINCNSSDGIIRISNDEIYNNGTGITSIGGCTVETAQNNRNAGNGVAGAPAS